MTAVLDRLDRSEVSILWGVIEPYFDEACRAVSTELTPAHIRREAMADRRIIWTVTDKDRDPPALLAVFSSGERQTQHGLTVFIEAIAGWDRESWLTDCLAEFERHAARAGATRIEIEGRLGWARVLPGYRPARIVLEKEL